MLKPMRFAVSYSLQLDIYPTKMVDFAGLTSWPDAEALKLGLKNIKHTYFLE